MFKKTTLLAAVATLALGFSAYAADEYTFAQPEDDYGRADVVDQPSLAAGQTDSLPFGQELNFAQPEDDYGRSDVVDQPSLARGFSDPLPRSQELDFARPVDDYGSDIR